MSADNETEIATVSSKGQITIPSSLRERYEIDEGDRLLAVPTQHGIVLKKIDLPSIEEFERRVEEREKETEIPLSEIEDLVHEKRGV
ncbi:AbrB/MazE/SpoVT family DNA-binding domain-containing protein [Halorutilales archaeon Cl-col2-1]